MDNAGSKCFANGQDSCNTWRCAEQRVRTLLQCSQRHTVTIDNMERVRGRMRQRSKLPE
jgi:hypothetical protein